MDVAVEITTRHLSADKVIQSVLTPSAGGTVIFIGTVRNSSKGVPRVSRVHLEAAKDLARSDLLRIARKAKSKYHICKLAVHHRIGRLGVGDVILVIAVSAPHRKAAFSACRFTIDELKKSTPIWKKEYGSHGSIWVTPER
jgi:molybdopterin synthase catalytic subunit